MTTDGGVFGVWIVTESGLVKSRLGDCPGRIRWFVPYQRPSAGLWGVVLGMPMDPSRVMWVPYRGPRCMRRPTRSPGSSPPMFKC